MSTSSSIDDYVMPDEAPEPQSNIGLQERGMPASPEAERSILGAVLLDSKHFAEAELGLSADDLSLDSHRRIYKRMGELLAAGRPVDLVSLVEELRKRKEIDAVGGVAYIASLTEGLPRRVSIDEYVRIVADKSIARQLIHKCNTIMTRAVDQSEHGTELVREMSEGMLDIVSRAKTIWRIRPKRQFFDGATTFLRDRKGETDWLVNGIIQRGGNGIIAGVPGATKSLMVIDLALHLITGFVWLGRDILRPAKVAIISREDYPGLTQDRAVKLAVGSPEPMQNRFNRIELDDWLYFNTRAQTETFSLQNENDVFEIIESIKERQIEIAIFDVFRRLWDGDENDNQEVARVLAVLTRIQTETGCAVALVHHLKKEQGYIFDRIRGSSAIYGWREWAIGIAIENPEEEESKIIRKLHFNTKAAASAAPIYYQIDSAMGKMDLVEVGAPERSTERPRRKVATQEGMTF